MQNQTMLQFFEWYLPDTCTLWQRVAAQAQALAHNGFTSVWLPPAYKGANGCHDVGYGVYDGYDLGEFDQKGSVSTKYGTKDQYLNAIAACQQARLTVLADMVMNHRMGADACQQVQATQYQINNRMEELQQEKMITAWTKFDYPARQNKYSDFKWDWQCFSGTDWDEAAKASGIYKFKGKAWNNEVDAEKGNYDYLMGADLDTDNPDVLQEMNRWAKWYYDTTQVNGFRLDAVKHMSFAFIQQWLAQIRQETKQPLYTVAEYWSPDTARLVHYLECVEHSLSLFDVPLHFHLYEASNSHGNYCMAKLFDNTLVQAKPENAVTFVDNHDTQPGQALQTYISAWFKPIAYALILLREQGLPCVFYGDYYGIPHDHIAPVHELPALVYIRKHYAYGVQHEYFDHDSIVGFTREGIGQNTGLAVLCTDSVGGTKHMYIGKQHGGKIMRDILHPTNPPVIINTEGAAEFTVAGGTVSVWLFEDACKQVEVLVP